MRLTRFAAVLILSFVPAFLAQGQMKILPREKVESVANPRLSRDSASLRFDRTSIDADPMNEDDKPKRFVYKFRNAGRDTLAIKRLLSTCSCVVAQSSRKVFAPGESGEISLVYDPKGHPGQFERKVFVYTQEGSDPAAVLKLKVNVSSGSDISDEWPVQIGYIRLRRRIVTFDPDRKAVERMRFINLDSRPVGLKCERMFLPDCLTFRTEPEIVGPGEEGEMVITYLPAGTETRDQVDIILKNTGVPPSRSSIIVKFD